MMKKIIKTACLFFCITASYSFSQPPRLTIVLVVDQFSQKILRKLTPRFKGAFAHLLKNGIVYEQANFPHGMPATATGHVALSTGAYAVNHGIIGNYWYDKTAEKKIKADTDTPQNAAVFSPNGFYDNEGVSSKNLLVDGISDQYMLANNNQNRAAYSFSLKSRAAVGMGNHQGKSIWFDSESGRMTSSKAYFDALPDWLNQFNTKHPVAPHHAITWRLMYPASSRAYRFDYAHDDRFSGFSVRIKRKQISLALKSIKKSSKYSKKYKWFEITPQANQYVLDCAYTYIQKELPQHQNMLIWISLSSLDKLGHRVGPYNISIIDMLYHLDKQINTFMRSVQRLLHKKDDIVYVLTGDHGCMPIPEYLAQDGYPAKRLNSDTIIDTLHKRLKKQFGVEDLVKQYKTPQFFLDEKKLETYPKEQQAAILKEIKKTLRAIPGIKHVWTFDELYHATYPPHSFEEHFKQQLYPQRSGLITVQVHPYVQLTDCPLGTGHKTPYNYDTQVPLIIYRKNQLEKKQIKQKVWTPQLAATLATILEIPRPSAATFGVLPGIFTNNTQGKR